MNQEPRSNAPAEPLVSCPFCDAPAEEPRLTDEMGGWTFECNGCHALILVGDGSRESAIAAWNRRAPVADQSVAEDARALLHQLLENIEFRISLVSEDDHELPKIVDGEKMIAAFAQRQGAAGFARGVEAAAQRAEQAQREGGPDHVLAAIRALAPEPPVTTSTPPPRRVRHKRRGTFYDVVGDAELQTARDLFDGEQMVVYRGEDGWLWVRPAGEFEDGRFEDVPRVAPEPPAAPEVMAGLTKNAWPYGCTDEESCGRHRQCMYLGCRHRGRDITAEIDVALALTRRPEG